MNIENVNLIGSTSTQLDQMSGLNAASGNLTGSASNLVSRGDIFSSILNPRATSLTPPSMQTFKATGVDAETANSELKALSNTIRQKEIKAELDKLNPNANAEPNYFGQGIEGSKNYNDGSKINKSKGEPAPDYSPSTTDDWTSRLHFLVPNWSYKDFLNERVEFVKGLNSATGDPAWCYFKIFFHFNTNLGLLGGILGNNENDTYTTNTMIADNCAAAWLETWKDTYKYEMLDSRLRSLKQFAGTLSYIAGYAPWFWQKINGLDKAGYIDFNEPIKKRDLEITCLEDAIDLRLTTMMEYYKYACFDYVNYKEIIPENLRKFDMTVVVYETPIRYIHTGMYTLDNQRFEYKSMNKSDNRMSFKMYTFYNCEFTGDSLGNYVPNEVSNDVPFQLGKNKLIIRYERCYQHMSNEFTNLLVGDTGFFDDANWEFYQQRRLNAMANSIDNTKWNPADKSFKYMVDDTEANIDNYMRNISPEVALGNLYGDYYAYGSDYFKNKMRDLRVGKALLNPSPEGYIARRGIDALSNKVQDKISGLVNKILRF